MTDIKVRKRRSVVKIKFDYPVVVVNRSNKNVQVQLLENLTKKTLFTLTSNKEKGTKTEQAIKIGLEAGQKIKGLGIDKVVFNRNGLLYHGRVKAVAEAIREQGITI
jgi:large subunit ribosomal protein L18